MERTQELKPEAQLTFSEAASIIVGHGVGSGILSVPYLASRNSWRDIILVVAVCWLINFLMHCMIAELSLNNHGAQFISCFRRELFRGRAGQILTWIAFGFLGLSVLVNCAGFLAGAGAVLESWWGLPESAAIVLYYAAMSLIVFYGLKVVGIAEKYSVAAMSAVVLILFAAVLARNPQGFQNTFVASSNIAALYSMVAFSLSAVMSVPQVVKGLSGDAGKIRGAIAAGTGVNTALMLLITVTTLLGAGKNITTSGALVDLASSLGGWVAAVGYIFSLLALSTSFWANTLNLRDIICEATGWKRRTSYLAGSLPGFVLAMTGLSSFVGFTRLAGVIQVLTGIGIIAAYHRSRKRVGNQRPVVGAFGTLFFEILVVASSILATAGSLVSIR